MDETIHLSKKDVIWGYIAQFFSIASGIITLPLILHILSKEEIGMNYLMLTIGSLVALFDFGFAPQFGRNITYIFSGAQILKKEGIETNCNKEVNYRLLSTMINTARFVYRRLAFFVLFFMLSIGTMYIYKVTAGFSNIHNSFIIWIVYSISTFFNIYYTYYSSLLTGKGLIMESKKAMIYSKSAYIILTTVFLLLGWGLLGVSLANLISPFVNRYISYHYFFTKDLKQKISSYHITKKEEVELFKIIWYNAKKLGLVFIGSYAITKFGMFLSGLYLSLSDVASYGLLIQLVGLIGGIASTLFSIYEPRFSALRVTRQKKLLLKDFAFSMGIYYCIFFIGSLCLVFIAPSALALIKSNANLPSISLVILYSIIILLEGNHSNFSTIIVTGNSIPFMWVSLITGGLIALFSYLTLTFTHLGLLGLILAQGIVQLSYNNWKWPQVVCKELKINFFLFLKIAFKEVSNRFILLCYGR